MRVRLSALLTAGGAAAAALSWAFLNPSPNDAGETRRGGDAGAGAPPAAAPRLSALPEREALGKPQGEPFAPRSWVPAAPKAAPKVAAPPAPPPMPYRSAGRVVREGVAQALLARGDTVFAVREGDTLEGGYRVETIAADHITLVYLPLGTRDRIELGPSPGARP